MTATKELIGSLSDFPAELGMCCKVGEKQVAVFFLPKTEEKWFAIDNFNPQNERMVLSRGIIGSQEGIPFVACPLHKYKYALTDGKCLTDEQYSVSTHEVTVEGDEVFLLVS